MKRILLFFMMVGLATTFAFSQTKKTHPVQGFTGINASGVFDITVTKSDTESLTIETDDEVMPYVRSEVRNGVLHLYLNGKEFKNIKTLKASVSMKTLDKVILSGACKLTTNDPFSSEEFKSDCSGANRMAVNVNTGQLSLKTSGANQIDIKANVTKANNTAEIKTSSDNFQEGVAKDLEVGFNFTRIISLVFFLNCRQARRYSMYMAPVR